jgi:hypothetical protein
MSEWTVKVPGNEHKLTTEELKLWAEGGKVKGDTIVVDSRGEHWTAKQIPGVFSKRDWLVALILSVLVGTLGIDRFYLGQDRHGSLEATYFWCTWCLDNCRHRVDCHQKA